MKVLTLQQLNSKNIRSLSPRAYKRDLMVFNRSCLDSSQRYVHRPYNTALGVACGLQARPGSGPCPGMVLERGQAYYDLEIVAGPDVSTAELKLGLEV